MHALYISEIANIAAGQGVMWPELGGEYVNSSYS